MAERSDVSVSVTWEAAPSGVVGLYRVQNGGKAAVYVFDRLYRTSVTGFRTVDPDYAWHWLEADGVFRVAKFVPQVPAGMKVESPEVAYARPLAAGGVLEGKVLLPGRLDQDLPYGGAPPMAAVANVQSIVFSLGYAALDPAVAANQIKAGDEIVWSLPFSWLIEHQRIISSEVFALQLPMQP
ncbi:hypothetical protein GCM10010873_35450 [Cypionkella aquatica]|uniref:Uncharacterized protein n=1 Tax=Cypionkella aquatica TaxID=1756042 RepID=A0AA37U501_9RHOB|nr:hypothetical protein [Cypionkella aquatica]GLS87385.1 hypothetical protein GCM10010873_23590 [Cypionkella aquatica]GLS88571.1 hypothetical protein GCM10010873_35450 [Cypionkella aquatica]